MWRFLPGFLAFLIGSSPVARAASTSQPFGAKGIPVKGFKLAEPHSAPHEGQTKSLLEGGKALVMPSGNAMLSEGVLLRTFTETAEPQLIVRADECFYDASNHMINSAGPIHMQTADGKFTIEGRGFSFWQQTNSTNSSLIISNNVHTLIESALLQTSPTNHSANAGQDGPLSIDSGSFNYDGPSGLGVWRTKVQVLGTNLLGTNLIVHSEVLTAKVPVGERQVQSLLAEREVTVKYSGIFGTGGRLNYAPDTGLVHLSEHATWKAEGEREGRGDELIIDQTNHIFKVNHHAWLKLPGQTLGESGFLSASDLQARKAKTSAKSWVEVECDHYEIRTNLAVFKDQVRLDEHVGNTIRSSLTCSDDLTATFAGTNELQTLTASKDVVISVKEAKPEEDKHFTGGRAFYTHTNTTLEMTQDPKWQSGPRQGKGDLIRINTEQQEMLVSGNASIRLPANELAGQLAPTVTTNRPPRTGTNQFAEIFCEQYTLRTNDSVFRGGVYATHPEMNWSCEKLTVQVPTGGLTNILADQKVVFEIMTQNGPFHGTGDNAIYSFGLFNSITNGVLPLNELKLTGTPAIVSTGDRIVQNPLVIWDRAKDKLTLPGSEYRIQGMAKAIDTNIFVLPNKKRTK